MAALVKKPWKILYVDYYSFLGGGQMNLLSLFAGMDRRRFQPLLVLPEEGPFAERARKLKVPVFLAPMGKARWRRFWEAWPAMQALRRIIAGQGVDLVHANCYPANKLAGPAARAQGVPCVWYKQIPVTRGWTTGKLWRWYSRYDDRILAVSRQVSEGLTALGIPAGKIELMYNHADVKTLARTRPLDAAQKKALGLPARARLVGTAGMRRPHKGFDHFLRTGLLLLDRHPGVHFVMAGGPSPAESAHETLLDSLAADPRWKGRLHVLPAQANLAPLLKSLDVFVCPSRFEGSPLTVLEAMALGRPVVATRQAAGELLRDGKEGLLVESGDLEGMGRAIEKLLQEPRAASALGRAAAEKARLNFSREAALGRLEKMYQGLLEAPR